MKGLFTETRYPCFLDVLAYVLFFFVSAVASAAAVVFMNLEGDALLSVGYMVMFAVLLGMSGIYRAVRRGRHRACKGPKGRIRGPKMALVGVVLMIAVQIVTEPLSGLDPSAERDYYDMLSQMGTGMILVSIIVAPVVEELFFRAILTGDIAGTRGVMTAVLLSSLFFSLAHIEHWMQVVPAFLGGVVLAYIYLVTRSVWSAIFVHSVNNLASQLYFLYSPTYEDFARPLSQLIGIRWIYDAIYLAACVLLVVVLSVGLTRLTRRYRRDAGQTRAGQDDDSRPPIVSKEGLEDTYIN